MIRMMNSQEAKSDEGATREEVGCQMETAEVIQNGE